MLVEWVVMRTGAEVNVGMGRFAVYLRAPVSICFQEGMLVVSFSLCGELNIFLDTVQVFKEVSQPILIAGPVDESIIRVKEPAECLWVLRLNAISLNSSMKKVAVTNKPIAMPLVCLQNWPKS
jgi:hypothetical protein